MSFGVLFGDFGRHFGVLSGSGTKPKKNSNLVDFVVRLWEPGISTPEQGPVEILRFGLPKGSLQKATIEKMAKAGYNITVGSRSYLPYVDDEELDIRLIRAQEVSRYVEHGYLDCGITGKDWIEENNSKVHEIGEFLFSKATRQAARWVLAVPEKSPIK